MRITTTNGVQILGIFTYKRDLCFERKEIQMGRTLGEETNPIAWDSWRPPDFLKKGRFTPWEASVRLGHESQAV